MTGTSRASRNIWSWPRPTSRSTWAARASYRCRPRSSDSHRFQHKPWASRLLIAPAALHAWRTQRRGALPVSAISDRGARWGSLLLAAAEPGHLLRRLGPRWLIGWGDVEEFLEVRQGRRLGPGQQFGLGELEIEIRPPWCLFGRTGRGLAEVLDGGCGFGAIQFHAAQTVVCLGGIRIGP